MLIFLKLPRPWVGVVDYAWDVDSMLRWEVPCHHTDIPGHDHGDEVMLVKMQNDVLVVDGCGRPQGVDGCWLLYLDILDSDGEEKVTSTCSLQVMFDDDKVSDLLIRLVHISHLSEGGE